MVNHLARASEKRCKGVVDYGCGDWQFSRLINWDGVQYLGLNLVDTLIEHHKKAYQKENITFLALDETPASLPGAELIILQISPKLVMICRAF
jgi:hypothetical protein